MILTGCLDQESKVSNEETSSQEELESQKEINDNLRKKTEEYQGKIEELKGVVDRLEEGLNEYEKEYQSKYENDLRSLIKDARSRFSHVQNGGERKDKNKTVEIDGAPYMVLGEDINTEKKLTSYLSVTFTPAVVKEIKNLLEIREYEGELIRPVADFTFGLKFEHAIFQHIQLEQDLLTLHLKAEAPGSIFQEEEIEFAYDKEGGWRLNSLFHKGE